MQLSKTCLLSWDLLDNVSCRTVAGPVIKCFILVIYTGVQDEFEAKSMDVDIVITDFHTNAFLFKLW